MTTEYMLHGENQRGQCIIVIPYMGFRRFVQSLWIMHKRGELQRFTRYRVQSAKPCKEGFKIGVSFMPDFLGHDILRERNW